MKKKTQFLDAKENENHGEPGQLHQENVACSHPVHNGDDDEQSSDSASFDYDRLEQETMQ